MKIASAELQMDSSHSSMQRREVSESLRMWVGPQRPDFENRGPRSAPAVRDSVVLSDAGKAAAAAETSDDIDEATENDPRTKLIRMMLEMLTGKSFRIFDQKDIGEGEKPQAKVPANPGNSTANTARPAGFGIEYDRQESYTEAETTRFSASGTVKTADGREISFNLELEMARIYHEESSVILRLGDAARKIDPLVLNFSGNAASLVDQRFSFDLNADGTEELIARLDSGSAYLVFDRNSDGLINNGKEMFGPTSGDGFSELAVLDDDSNGWIDENDRAFSELRLWQPDASGKGELRTLQESGVGALSLARIATPFELKGNDNSLLGTIRSSGIFLQEAGMAGTIQQIDLTV